MTSELILIKIKKMKKRIKTKENKNKFIAFIFLFLKLNEFFRTSDQRRSPLFLKKEKKRRKNKLA